MDKIPVSLDKDPILEALFEIRFQRKNIPPPEILPGIIFAQCKEDFNLIEIERFPIPEELINREENLKYVPQVKIKGENYGIQVADSAVSLSRLKPYCGWKDFKKAIRLFLEILENQKENVFARINRFSLKYVNLFEEKNDISLLNLTIEMNKEKITSEKFFLAIEKDIEDKKLIIHINNQVAIPFKDNLLRGLLLSVDVIYPVNRQNIDEDFCFINDHLEEAHDKEKETFFSLISKELLKQMEPRYD